LIVIDEFSALMPVILHSLAVFSPAEEKGGPKKKKAMSRNKGRFKFLVFCWV